MSVLQQPGLRVWAVVGDVLNTMKPASSVVQRLQKSGRQVLLVNPRDETGQCFTDLATAAAEAPIDAVNLIINPKIGLGVVRDMKDLGIKHLFIQPGADTPPVLAEAERLGLTVEQGCVLVQSIPPL